MENKQSLYSDMQVEIDTLRSASDLLKEAIEIFKQRVGVFITMGLLSVIPSMLSPVIESLYDKLTPGIISSIFVLLLNRFIIFLYFAALLCLVSERSIGVKDSFQKALYKVWPLFLTGVLAFVITALGYVFLIIPGIIFSIQFQFVPFVVVIDRLKGRAALSKSKDLVGDKWLKIMWRSSFIIFVLMATYFVFDLFGIKIISKIVNSLVPQIVMIYYFLLYENLKKQVPEPKNDSTSVGYEIESNIKQKDPKTQAERQGKKISPSGLVLLIISALIIGFLIKTGVIHRIIETYIPFPEQNIEIEEEAVKERIGGEWKVIDDPISNVEIILREDKFDENRVYIFIKSFGTDKEEFFVTLSDVDKIAYFEAEFRNGHLYILKRTITGSKDWQLLKYSSPKDKGVILFMSEMVAPFRVSPDEAFLTILGRDGQDYSDYSFEDTLVFINLDTEEQREFNSKDLTTNEILSYREEIPVQSSVWIKLGEWTEDSKSFLGYTKLVTSADPPMPSEATVFKINVESWKVEKFQIPFDYGVIILSGGLNLEREAVLYERVFNGLSLHVYDFILGEKKTVISYSNEVFNTYCEHVLSYYYYSFDVDCYEKNLEPNWIDKNTISYFDFENREKIIKEID